MGNQQTRQTNLSTAPGFGVARSCGYHRFKPLAGRRPITLTAVNIGQQQLGFKGGTVGYRGNIAGTTFTGGLKLVLIKLQLGESEIQKGSIVTGQVEVKVQQHRIGGIEADQGLGEGTLLVGGEALDSRDRRPNIGAGLGRIQKAKGKTAEDGLN